MSKVLLVKAGQLFSHRPNVVPPIGLLYLASVLRQRGRHDVRIFDSRLVPRQEIFLRKYLEEYEPDIVGISAITLERRSAARLVATTRSWNPGVPIMIGGPHATALPQQALEETGADAAVLGEGEEVIEPLVSMLCERVPPRLPGVVTRDHAGHATPPALAPPPVLEHLPLPAWDLVSLEEYHRRFSGCILSPWKSAPISTSRGCPWQCTYCHNLHGKRFRGRSVESVREELRYLASRMGSGVIEVHDDNFNASPTRAKEILELFCQTDGRLVPAFPNGLRADRMDAQILDLMKDAGTRFVSYAVETGNQDMQRRIKKNLDLDAAMETICESNRRNLFTDAFFMIGLPDETLPQMLDTVRFSLKVPLTMAHFFRVLPLPGSELWNLARARGLDVGCDDDYFVAHVNLSAEPDWVLEWAYRMAYLAFYGRPRQAWRFASRFPDKRNLAAHVATLLPILWGSRRNSYGRTMA